MNLDIVYKKISKILLNKQKNDIFVYFCVVLLHFQLYYDIGQCPIFFSNKMKLLMARDGK